MNEARNLSIVPNASALTMSSREIAELVDARHNDVASTIERLFEQGVLRESRNTTRPFIPNGGGRPTQVYDLTFRDTMVVVSGYSAELRARIIDRWQQLEAHVAGPQLPDFTQPAIAARAWADQFELRVVAEAKQRQLAAENATLVPKAAVADAIATAEGLHSMQAVAKILGTGRTRLFEILRGQGILDRRNLPKQEYVERGYFRVKECTFFAHDANQLHAQTFVTGKGLTWLGGKLVAA